MNAENLKHEKTMEQKIDTSSIKEGSKHNQPENHSSSDNNNDLKKGSFASRFSKNQNTQVKEPSDQLESLKIETEQLKAQIEQLKEQLLRTAADRENTKRIMEKQASDARDYSMSNFARDIINSCDNLERAIPGLKEGDAIHEGIMFTWKELMNVLKRHNIQRIDPIEKKFDPNYHQSIGAVVDNEKEDGTVVEVKQVGYIIKDRVLRPAMVIISKVEMPS